jgi:hypothetical protein
VHCHVFLTQTTIGPQLSFSAELLGGSGLLSGGCRLLLLLRDGEDEAGDVAFDLDALFEVAVLVECLFVGEGLLSRYGDFLDPLVARVLDAEHVSSFGDTFEVKAAVAAEVGVDGSFFVFWIFDSEMSAVDGVAIAGCSDHAADGVKFAERDGDVFSAAILAWAGFNEDRVADMRRVAGVDA